jgi:hypothetical protein
LKDNFYQGLFTPAGKETKKQTLTKPFQSNQSFVKLWLHFIAEADFSE